MAEEENQISILIICEQPKKFRLMMKQLSRDGWGVSAVSNVKKALQSILTNPPSHVFVSYNVKGISVLKVAKIVSSTFNLPVILFPESHDYQTSKIMRETNWPNKLNNQLSATVARTTLRRMMGIEESKEEKKSSLIRSSIPTKSEDDEEQKSSLINFNNQDSSTESKKKKEGFFGIFSSKEENHDEEEDEEAYYDGNESELDDDEEAYYAKAKNKHHEIEDDEESYYSKKKSSRRMSEEDEDGEELYAKAKKRGRTAETEDQDEQEYLEQEDDNWLSDEDEEELNDLQNELGLKDEQENQNIDNEEYDADSQIESASAKKKKSRGYEYENSEAASGKAKVFHDEDQSERFFLKEEKTKLKNKEPEHKAEDVDSEWLDEEQDEMESAEATGSISPSQNLQDKNSHYEKEAHSDDSYENEPDEGEVDWLNEEEEKQSKEKQVEPGKKDSLKSSGLSIPIKKQGKPDDEPDLQEEDDFEEDAFIDEEEILAEQKEITKKIAKKNQNKTVIDNPSPISASQVEDLLNSFDDDGNYLDDDDEDGEVSNLQTSSPIESKKEKLLPGEEDEPKDEDDLSTFEKNFLDRQDSSAEVSTAKEMSRDDTSAPNELSDAGDSLVEVDDTSWGRENDEDNNKQQLSDVFDGKIKTIIKDALQSTIHPTQDVDNDIAVEQVVAFHVSCEQHNGLIYFGIGNSNTIGSGLVNVFLEKLTNSFNKENLDVDIHRPVTIHIKDQDFKKYIIEKCDYHHFSSHNGEVVITGFQEGENIIPNISKKKDMYRFDAEGLPTKEKLDFDVYIYLPINDKFLRYICDGGELGDEQKKRLKKRSLQDFHVKEEDVMKLKDFYVQKYASKKIAS